MKTIYVDAKWEGKLELGKDLLLHLTKLKAKKVALFASVQFLALDDIKKQLKNEGMEVLTTKANRTDVEAQVLGCDAYHDSFESDIIEKTDAILYIGDGLFHPKALLLSQRTHEKTKDIIIWDPVSKKMRIITKDDISKQLQKMKANIKRYLSSTTIGILVTIKPGQQYLHLAKKLKQTLESEGKKGYIFIDDTLSYHHFENYPFIDCWVNTACPRIGMDDIVNMPKPLINIREAFDPIRALEEFHA